jgi:hypothetical protein
MAGNVIPELPPYQMFIPKFLTYVPGRNIYSRKYQGFKQHQRIGDAKNAINQALSNYGYSGSAHRMGIWEFNFSTNEWVLLYDIAPGTLIRDLPWRKDD